MLWSVTLKIGALTKLGLFFPEVCFIHSSYQTLAEQLCTVTKVYGPRALVRILFNALIMDSACHVLPTPQKHMQMNCQQESITAHRVHTALSNQNSRTFQSFQGLEISEVQGSAIFG